MRGCGRGVGQEAPPHLSPHPPPGTQAGGRERHGEGTAGSSPRHSLLEQHSQTLSIIARFSHANEEDVA